MLVLQFGDGVERALSTRSNCEELALFALGSEKHGRGGEVLGGAVRAALGQG
jgi:hypothetical protein